MKRFTFLVCGVLLLESFGFELSMSQNFVQKLEPSVMQISFTLNTKASSAEAIRERLHPLIKEMKKSTICSGGAYAISPEYKYEKDRTFSKPCTLGSKKREDTRGTKCARV